MLKLITIIGNIVIFVCGIWLLTMLSVLLHEFGHALGYMLSTGDRDWHIEVGQGKQLLNTKPLTINLFVIDGFLSADENKLNTKTHLITTLAGGPIMSLLLVAGRLVLKFGGISPDSEVLASGMIKSLYYIALFINLLILLWSVIPAHGFFRDMDDVGTDVMQIINTLKRPEK